MLQKFPRKFKNCLTQGASYAYVDGTNFMLHYGSVYRLESLLEKKSRARRPIHRTRENVTRGKSGLLGADNRRWGLDSAGNDANVI